MAVTSAHSEMPQILTRCTTEECLVATIV